MACDPENCWRERDGYCAVCDGSLPGAQNCGYDPTCAGWVIRVDGFHIATFRRKADADQYVALMERQPATVEG